MGDQEMMEWVKEQSKKCNKPIDAVTTNYKYISKDQFDRMVGTEMRRTLNTIFANVRIIYNDPATIVFWGDGTKTIVKRAKGEKYNEYNAFCSALAKRIYITNSAITRMVKSGYVQKPHEAKKKKGGSKK